MSAQHTPGPWEWHRDHPTDVIYCPTCGCSLATIDIGCGDKAEQQANARLIAAAPDLLEALSWFINDIDGTHTVMVEFDENVAKARAAIAKAKGSAA